MKNSKLMLAVLAVLFALASPAYSQRTTVVQGNQPKGQPNPKQTSITQTPPAPADYNLGLIVKKVAALEAQVALLKKQNETLASQFSSQQKVNDTLTSENVGSSRVDLQACKLEYSIVSPK